MNKITKQKQSYNKTDTENKQMVARGEKDGGVSEIDEGD